MGFNKSAWSQWGTGNNHNHIPQSILGIPPAFCAHENIHTKHIYYLDNKSLLCSQFGSLGDFVNSAHIPFFHCTGTYKFLSFTSHPPPYLAPLSESVLPYLSPSSWVAPRPICLYGSLLWQETAYIEITGPLTPKARQAWGDKTHKQTSTQKEETWGAIPCHGQNCRRIGCINRMYLWQFFRLKGGVGACMVDEKLTPMVLKNENLRASSFRDRKEN